MIGLRAHRRTRITDGSPRPDPPPPALLQGSDPISRSAACRDAYYHILIIDLVLLQIHPSLLLIILCILDRFADSVLSPRNHPDDQIKRHTIGGRDLTVIQAPQSPPPSGSNI